MKTTKVHQLCPWCGKHNDRASSVEGEHTPSEGDFSPCIGCGEWSVFQADLSQRKPTDAEFAVLAEDPHARRARKGWLRMRDTLGAPPARTAGRA